MTPAVEQDLQQCFTQLSSAEQTSFLQLIKTIVTERGRKQERVGLEQYNRKIDEVAADLKKGKV